MGLHPSGGLLAIAGILVLTIGVSELCADEKPAPPADPNVYETDRPGEVENPFALPPGRAELISYVVEMNAAAREDEFGGGGSSLLLDATARFGMGAGFEGVATIDRFLRTEASEGADAVPSPGVSYATVLAKWNFLRSATGDLGIAVAPFIRLPLDRGIGRSSRSESGLLVPFDFDLEGGWEVQGSTGVAREPTGARSWNTQVENQASLERTVAERWTAYLELQLASGEGPPAWATEFGMTTRLNAAVRIDVGCSLGIGRDSRGRMAYAGIGCNF